jgi:hypothetical protein
LAVVDSDNRYYAFILARIACMVSGE